VKLSPGNVHDIDTAFEFLDELPATSKNLLADKGYDSDLFRKSLRSLNREPVIPGRKNRKKEVPYDREKYSGRHVVENAFCSLKQFRSIATRYEKLDINFYRW
jgi:transposase